MADLHQIIDLGALTDDGVADGAAVDCGAGADFHIVLDYDAAQLRHFDMTARTHHETKAILPNVTAGVDDHAVADDCMNQGRTGTDKSVAADTD